ncbi:hypothetical protein BU251_09335 [Candidatus Velamenicoccus archaeovorus]|uniref:Uncharacterized protein n=1 Tax=Velamenicoccus archaeovorus TaxID=1930593 RepID=A0A410P716_VELA1|nr:hypothetical protein BU251_09335 [Candidatus Velamenicoccus archaeovorus]
MSGRGRDITIIIPILPFSVVRSIFGPQDGQKQLITWIAMIALSFAQDVAPGLIGKASITLSA